MIIIAGYFTTAFIGKRKGVNFLSIRNDYRQTNPFTVLLSLSFSRSPYRLHTVSSCFLHDDEITFTGIPPHTDRVFSLWICVPEMRLKRKCVFGIVSRMRVRSSERDERETDDKQKNPSLNPPTHSDGRTEFSSARTVQTHTGDRHDNLLPVWIPCTSSRYNTPRSKLNCIT